MIQNNKKSFFLNLAINICLLIVGVLLFTLAQPNLFNENGLPIFSYFAFIPVFILARRVSWKTVWLYGLIYGIASYCLYAYWLATFHPMGILVISCLYGVWLLVMMPLLKLVTVLFPKKGWIVQWVLWCAYEYLKTKGFAGFQYGVTAYSHWRWLVILQCVDVIGLFGLNAIILFPSAWFSAVITDFTLPTTNVNKSNKKSFFIKAFLPAIKKSTKKHLISVCIWIVCFVAVIIYGFVSPIDYSSSESIKVALIQQNSDPWKDGTVGYRRDLNTLMTQTDLALAENPDIQMVVWPETSFVPRLTWNYQYRQDRERFDLVEQLLTYIDSKTVPFVIGNDHAELGYTRSGEYDAIDYNTAMVLRPSINVIPPAPELYFKMHLVPFTEYFPFDKQFPKINELLLNGDTHMWEPGVDPVVFNVDGLRFGTPICFEDTFGDISRKFVQNGANATVNLSNDAWSKSLACQYQHLSMAVVHAVECRIPTVRATASGQTAIVDPNGKILAMAEPFIETYVTGTIPIQKQLKNTLYVKFGDYAGVLFSIAALLILVFGIVKAIVKHSKK